MFCSIRIPGGAHSMTNTERLLDLAVADGNPARAAAAINLADAWQIGDDRPLDRDGPTEIPFEPFDDAAVERSIASRFCEIAERYPSRTAIDDGELRLTYAAVWHIACHLARQVERLVPVGRPVAVVLPNATLFPVAALACFVVGRPYVPIDLDYPAARNIEILREAGAAAAITQAGLPAADALVPPSLPRIYADAAEAPSAPDGPPLDPVNPGGPALILFTSGSTGRPKGICNTQAALLLRIAHYTNTCHLNAEDRFILLSSPSVIAGVRQSFAALLNGATLRIAELRRLGINGVQRVIRDEHITVYHSVPAVLRAVLRGANPEMLASLRIVRLAGEAAFEPDLALCRAAVPPTCHIFFSLGSTEAPTVFQWFPRSGMGDGLSLPSGFAIPGLVFALVGPDGAPVPSGEVGELIIRSRYIALGLWQNGRLVSGPFESDPADPDVRILRTGDLFRLRPDGLAEHHGRNDRQVKIRGIRVDPGEVEAALRRCDGVADAAVIVRRENSTDSSLVGFVVPQPGSLPPVSKYLRQQISTWLPAAKCPAVIHVIDEIPRLPSFKADNTALANLDLTSLNRNQEAPAIGDAVAEQVINSRRIQDAVKRTWTAICGARSMARNQSWEDAGGDSLKALHMLLQIEEDLNLRLSTDVLSEGMTPSTLGAAIERFIDAAPRDGAPSTAEDQRIKVFLMPGIVYDEPDLARFRHALRNQIRFIVIGYPNWRDMIAARADFEAVVSDAVAQILSQCGDDPICLAGYSFGGFVAFAAAHRLSAAQHRVGFLGLLDPRRRSAFSASPLAGIARRMTLGQRLQLHLQTRDFAVVLRLGLRILLEIRAFAVAASLAKLCVYINSRRAVPHLIYVLRSYTMRGWQPKPLPVATSLFRSEEQPHPHEIDWRAWCSPFTVVPVAGDHETMLAATNTERLCAQFVEALHKANSSVDPSLVPSGPAFDVAISSSG
jgi:non-ribosomal peptide synthetase component F/thioesterase domain-containing protein